MTDTPQPGTPLPWKAVVAMTVDDRLQVRIKGAGGGYLATVWIEGNSEYLVYAANKLPKLEEEFAEWQVHASATAAVDGERIKYLEDILQNVVDTVGTYSATAPDEVLAVMEEARRARVS